MKEVKLDFSKWEASTGKPKEYIGTIAGQVLSRAIFDGANIYLDEDTDNIYVPIMSASFFKKYYGNVMSEEKGD